MVKSSAAVVPATLYAMLFSVLVSCGQHGLPKSEIVFPPGINSVDIPFTRYRDWIIIPVKVNDSRPLSFIFDTGAPIGVLAKADNSINMSYSGTIPVAGSDPNKPRTVPLATDVTFTLGDVLIKNGVAAIGAASEAIAGTDGILGKYLLENADITIDWDRQLLMVHKPGQGPRDTNAMSIPLTLSPTGHVYTTVQVSRNGQSVTVKAIVDTGAKSVFSIDKSQSATLLEREPVLKDFIVLHGANGPQRGDMARGEVGIGTDVLQHTPITFRESDGKSGLARAGIHANIGLGILDRYNLTFSLREGRLYLTPRSNLRDPFVTNRTGIITKPGHEKKIEVAGVIPHSPAQAAGITAGDFIVAIDGKKTDTLTPHDVFVELKAAGKSTLQLSVDRAGQAKQITLTLKESI